MDEPLTFSREVIEALGAAFPEDEVEFLPRGFYNGKARALAYIDARSVMRRLDAVVGPGNWSFDFEVLSPDGKMVKGRLTVLGVTKCDAGEANAEDEPLKSAVSDAMKRCGVHFGIGRYLYYLPQVWAPYDQQKRRFTETPRIAPDAVARALAICGISTPAVVAGSGTGRDSIWAAGPAREATSTPPAETRGRQEATKRVQRTETQTVAGQIAGGPTPPQPAPSGGLIPPEGRVCSGSGCGKALTPGQHDISIRAFGQPLCPACQKERARAAQ